MPPRQPHLPSDGEVEFGSFKMRGIPRQIMIFVVLVAGIAALAYGYRQWNDPELVSAKQANASLLASVSEYGLHIAEAPEKVAELLNDARGKLVVQLYPDGCVLLAQVRHGKVRSKLVVDLDRLDEHTNTGLDLADLFTVYAESSGPKCLNPHPGRFDTWFGAKPDPCWVEVWRRWPDGCQHVQMYNTCYNFWDSNADRTPRVKWTSCVH